MEMARSPDGLSIELTSEEDTSRLGHALAELVEPGVVIGLVGPLGAGKTRLVRAIAEALGRRSGSDLQPHVRPDPGVRRSLPVYHLDTYRLPGPVGFRRPGRRRLLGKRRFPRRVGRPGPLPPARRLLDNHPRSHRTDVAIGPDRAAPSARSVLDRLIERLT